MKYDKDRGGYVLSREELNDLNDKMQKARRLVESLDELDQLRPWLAFTPGQKKLLN